MSEDHSICTCRPPSGPVDECLGVEADDGPGNAPVVHMHVDAVPISLYSLLSQSQRWS